MPRIPGLVAIVVVALPSGGWAQDAYFEESFDSAARNPNLTGYEGFSLAGGAVRPTPPSDNIDRRYMRTVVTDYNLRDWVYELTITAGSPAQGDIALVGVGHGDRRSGSTFSANEPIESIFFRIHSPHIADGFYEIASAERAPVLQGNIASYGPHRVRITKSGNSLTFELDEEFDGEFEADSTHTFGDLEAHAPWLDLTDTHLFFGAVWPACRFDDLRIAHPFEGASGGRRSIDATIAGNRVTATVTIEVDRPGEPYTLEERFDPGWTVTDISGGGVYSDALVWTDVTASRVSYRLSRADAYFASGASVEGRLLVGGQTLAVTGDREVPGSVLPFVSEVLVTPSFKMGGGLNGCSVRPADVAADWVGTCLGLTDRSMVPSEGLRFRPSFGTQWSRAAGLDAGLGAEARRRFWADPARPAVSDAILVRAQADREGRYDWQSAGIFGANVDDTMCVAYFYVVNDSDEPRRVNIGLGSDDSSGVRVNGDPIFTEIGCGGPACFDGKHQFLLRPGKNLIAFYTFERSGDYGACLRFEDDDGNPAPMRTTLDASGYEVDGGSTGEDCNRNCVDDGDDIAVGVSRDENADGVPDECQPSTLDCNGNGIADAGDISSGASPDANGDGVPDECQQRIELEDLGSLCVAVRLTTLVGTRGGEFGIAFDSSRVTPSCAQPGVDFLGTEPNIFCDLSPRIICDPGEGVDAGFTVGWINGGTGEIQPPGSYELLRLCFRPVEGDAELVCSPLRFTSCLGLPGAPTENVITAENNSTVLLNAAGGTVCGRVASFRRGDANGDGRFDISDPIMILGCQFLGTPCPECADAGDANDDGELNIADPIYLLSWRFLDGPGPLDPSTECGRDPTPDDLISCVYESCP